MDNFVGVDLGGTKIAAEVLNVKSGERSGLTVIPTEAAEGPDHVLRRIDLAVRQVCQSAGLKLEELGGVGVGLPGTMDDSFEHTLMIPNMAGDWYMKPVAPVLQDYLKCPVRLINDARSFTLAEATLGAGRGAHIVACFTLGTGIGGGIAIDGKLLMGVGASAGEFGHMTIDIHGPLCGCGNHGCMESLGSGPAITTMAIKAVVRNATTIMRDLVDGDLNKITPRTIMQAAEQNDAIALDILEQAGDYLGAGIANVLTILSPNCVIIGGGVSHLGEWILKPIRAAIKRRCKAAPLDRIEIALAALGDEAGMIGSAMWAWQRLQQ